MGLFGSKREYDFDLAVVGGGSGAFAAAIRAAELGAKVAVVESGVVGGTCVNRGCVPTKNLLHGAERYHLYRQDGFPGVPQGRERADFKALFRQKDELVQYMRKAKYEDILASYPSISYITARGRFLSAHEVSAGEKTITSDEWVVATGASPAVPPIDGLADSGFLTYKEALELDELPDSLVVMGAGAIGLELGQMFSRLGSRVVVLEMLPRVAPNEEAPISRALEEYLVGEGIEIHTGAKVLRLRKESCCVTVEADVAGSHREFQAEKLLLAAGLRPNTADMGLERAGVELDGRGAVRVDDGLRTTARNVWAVGDVLGRQMLVTTAALEGGLAAENALLKAGRKLDDEAIPHAIFTDPQVASVGLSESEASRRGLKVRVASIPFELVPKAGAIRDPRGLLRMIVDEKSYRILGVHMVAPSAADLIHVGVLAVRHKLTVGDLLRATFVYPTLAEAFKIAALSFSKDVTKLSCCAQ